MTDVVCQVTNQPTQVELIWSSRGGFFRPYLIRGPQLAELRQSARSAREALMDMVVDMNTAGDSPTSGQSSYELAVAGSMLYNSLVPAEDETAGKVKRWLEDLRTKGGLISLEVVEDEQSSDPKTVLSVPWNLVYDDLPDTYQAEFEAGQASERWRPFWGIRYNLTCGRRVEPWRRLPNWSDPRVVVVVDPRVYSELREEQRQQLDEFLESQKLERLESLSALKKALNDGYPRLLYWMGHGCPDYLQLGADKIEPGLLRNLLRSYSRRERPEGMLAFLNACQTGESGDKGSFLEVLHSFGFTGAVATEQQTIDNFANEFGLAFLKGFLAEGQPLGQLLHKLRLEKAPLGLLYGAHCPPEIRVRVGAEGAADSLPEIRELTTAAGQRMRVGLSTTLGLAAVRTPPLPEQPYPSLAYYDEADRLLFTGRDTDIVRFAAALDLSDTRLLVLHGESGLGKSSFLRAGVIPYLEESCAGYRFLRGPDGRVVIVQAAGDPVGRLAQALLDMTWRRLEYETPTGEPLVIDLRPVLDEALGAKADLPRLRTAMLADAGLLAALLTSLADRLPHALVLVVDQGEELFTLARTAEELAWRDQALKLLQRVADVKVILSLRTEYYGRLLDHLREGRHDLTGVRDDLLRDFTREALIEAIVRPTRHTPLAPGQPSPREKYRFEYEVGVPEVIADGVLKLRSENQDSVLPVMQVICMQLYEREARPGGDGVVNLQDLDAIKGVDGGLKAFAEDALKRNLKLSQVDADAFKDVFVRLYNRQPDGTLTTWMAPREGLEACWRGGRLFDGVLAEATKVRLLREDQLRIEGGEPRSYVRLGHDALAKVAAAWQAEREEQDRLEQEKQKRRKQFRRVLAGVVSMACVTLVFGVAVLIFMNQNAKLKVAKANATAEKEHAQTQERAAREAQAEATREAARAQQEEEHAVIEARKAKDAEERAVKQAALAKASEVRERAEKANAVRSEAVAESRARVAKLRLMRPVYEQIDQLWRTDPGKGREMLLDHRNFASLADRDFAWRCYFGLCDRARIVSAHGGGVRALAWRADGKMVASAWTDGIVRIWDSATRLENGDLEREIKCGSLAFSPDGRTLAMGSVDGSIRLWDTEARQERPSLKGHEGSVYTLAYSPDGSILASAGVDKTIRLWNAASGALKSSLLGHGGPVGAIDYSPDGTKIVSASQDCTVRLWDASTGDLRATLTGHAKPVVAVAFDVEGVTVASGSDDGTVRLWDATDGKLRDTLIGHKGSVFALAFSPDRRTLASGSADNTIRLWPVGPDGPSGPAGARGCTLRGHGDPVWALAYSPDGTTLVSGADDKTIRLWAMPGDLPQKLSTSHTRPARSADFSPDGKTLVTCGDDNVIRLWDVASGRELSAMSRDADCWRVAFSPDGGTIAAAASNGRVRLWETTTRSERPALVGHEGPVRSVAFSPVLPF